MPECPTNIESASGSRRYLQRAEASAGTRHEGKRNVKGSQPRRNGLLRRLARYQGMAGPHTSPNSGGVLLTQIRMTAQLNPAHELFCDPKAQTPFAVRPQTRRTETFVAAKRRRPARHRRLHGSPYCRPQRSLLLRTQTKIRNSQQGPILAARVEMSTLWTGVRNEAS